MSGEHIKARAGVATGTGAAGEPETAVATGPSRGAKYAGPADKVETVVTVPAPLRNEPDAPDETHIEDGPTPTHGTGLTRAEILKFRREWQEDGLPSPWKRAGVSEATYIRHRHKNGLVPWPAGYRHPGLRGTATD